VEDNSIHLRKQGSVTFIRIQNGEKNCINAKLIDELTSALEECEKDSNVVVLEGNDKYFCYGADFAQISDNTVNKTGTNANPATLFDLWKKMSEMPCIIISHVQGAVNAGGVGFVSASDIVIASPDAAFSLSELLFGLMPAMVMPFLIRRIGYSKANFMTLTTRAIDCNQAKDFGLVDILSDNSTADLRKLLARISKIPKDGIARYKRYVNKLSPIHEDIRTKAIDANLEVFTDEVNLKRIADFTLSGKYPWE
jgi:polyketide biosynthesis enoyl-CoA hydratase PksH